MKTLSSLLSLPMAALVSAFGLGLVSSCDLGSDYEHHQTTFIGISSEGRIVYADQTLDTLRLYSTDSWTLSLSDSTAAAWLTASPSAQTIEKRASQVTPIPLTFTPNASGAIRRTGVLIHSSYSSQYSVGMPVAQLPFHAIARPVGRYTTLTPGRDDLPVFSETLRAEADTTVAVFHLFAPSGTLTSSAEWLKVDQPTAQKGDNRCRLSFEANPSSETRSATVTLTTGDISTRLIYTQSGRR